MRLKMSVEFVQYCEVIDKSSRLVYAECTNVHVKAID
jgi:hypothetical protein